MKKLLTLCLFSILSLGAASAQQEITLDRGDVTLSGTLLMPDGVAKPPVVLIIAGSGPTDRDGNNRLAGNNNSLKNLALDLQKAGIASLRYDKRMIGKSVGTLKEQDLTFDDFVDDARALVDMLYSDGRFSEVVIAGHSEGSLIGMIAATDNQHVAKFISLAGMGLSFRETVMRQLRSNPNNPEWVFTESERIFASLEKGELVPDARPELAVLFRPSAQPVMISMMKYNPTDVIAGLKIPVMIVGGSTDIQVSKEDYERLLAASPHAAKIYIDDMNHVLKQCAATTLMVQAVSYADSESGNHPNLAPAVIEFIKAKSCCS